MSFFTRSRQLPDQERAAAEEGPTPDGVVPGEEVPADGEAGDREADDGVTGRRRGRAVAAGLTTALACLLVLFALLAPNRIGQLTPGEFLRIPVEGLLGVALVLVLPERARRIVAVPVGVLLGLLTIVKIVDMGFYAALARPFNPVLDWISIEAAVGFLTDSVGRAGAIAAVIGAVLLAIAVPILMTLSVLRLTRLVLRHRSASAHTVTALGAACIACAVFGVQIVPDVPVGTLAYDRVLQARAGFQDQKVFATEADVDAFRDTPGDQLLTALRGKDVVVAFVESYGRDAVEDPEFAPQVGAVLDAGNARLNAAGYTARSGWLTSPTAGGGSWLAHATLLSGLWIDNQQRYNNLVVSDRLTLNGAFQRAQWRTVGVMPAINQAWPEGAFFRYDQIYPGPELGYRGPKFSYAPMPDQYTLSAFERAEHAKPNRPPVMATIPLVSSHAPWAPIPQLVDWKDVGDGSVFGPIAAAGESPDDVWRDTGRVRTEYRRSIEYSLNTLVSYVETYGDDNLVLVFLGDHQATPLVTGEGASRDVPITIVAHDRAVLDRISGWGWQDGLRPGPQTPVWPMDAFRDRFLTTFGP
ncbi:sulfatase [Plantactinospora solaniradicis]|uniref:Sulfatase n=1 Tax=Plantactinospora solaniradicis TaxID=1723736 RepID=A0ABW1K481_9ACTN